MPILHFQFSNQGTDLNGQPVPMEPRAGLAMRGPIVSVLLKVPPEIVERLIGESKPIPNSINGFGLIDTGAASSCIDSTAAQSLGLPVVDVIKMASATHADVETNVYPITFDILGGAPITVRSPRAAGAALANQGLLLLIGRDLLAHMFLSYSGTSGTFTLCY
jgi:predicted aspartyl protease